MSRTDTFLSGVAGMIDEDERAAVAAAHAEPLYPYRDVHDGPGFVVVGGHLPGVGAFVRLGGVRGRVVRVDARTVLVRFDGPVDPPATGVLEPAAASFRAQRDALTRMRGHPLLAPLAHGRVAAFTPSDAVPEADLDPDQLDAYRRALAVPDLLLVLGAPGTGKTRLARALPDDLLVVDDAERLGLPDLLVALTGARRAVVLGDPRGEVPARLAARLPAANVARLTRRRPVPAEIAAFRARLCGDAPGAAGDHVHRDDVFAEPVAFVDTSGVPERRRRERPARRRDDGRQGYYNPVEAHLLAQLAAHYEATGRDWAVVVPDSAQAEEVTARIVAVLGGEARVRRNVGAARFRGGERQVVLYGFTRGSADLRETGAALETTRAAEQLVLVGDLPALARDDVFRDRVRVPETRGYDEVLARIARVASPPGVTRPVS